MPNGLLWFISDIDECASTPCANGGVCSDEVGAYSCTCGVGYAGLECATGRDVLYYCLYFRPLQIDYLVEGFWPIKKEGRGNLLQKKLYKISFYGL